MGQAICKAAFAGEGAKVAIFDLSGDATRKLSAELGEQHSHVEALDISDYAAVEAAVARTETVLGPIDVLVNNAGWDRFQMFLDTDAEFRKRVIGCQSGRARSICIMWSCKGWQHESAGAS